MKSNFTNQVLRSLQPSALKATGIAENHFFKQLSVSFLIVMRGEMIRVDELCLLILNFKVHSLTVEIIKFRRKL